MKSISGQKNKHWTKQELEYIRANYQKKTIRELAKFFKVTRSSIGNAIYRILNLSKENYRRWRPEELDFIQKNYEHLTNYELAEKLKTSPDRVAVCISKKLKLKRSNRLISIPEYVTHQKSWTEREDKIMMSNLSLDWVEIAQKLNRTPMSCQMRFYRIKKSLQS